MSGYTWQVAAGRLLLAALCGAIIGWEREVQHKGAGLRTHILISIGACLFTVTALRMRHDFGGGDVLRLVQGMILGVGFLTGGVILTQGGSVHGLTTAAGLWVLSGVGMAAGLGYIITAATATILVFAVTSWMKHVEARMAQNKQPPSEVD